MRKLPRHALVSGYGIAGASIAYWLTRAGWDVTVVERAGDVRSSGAPVDVRGDAVAAVRAMGMYDELRARSTGVTEVEFVGRGGRRIGGFPMQPSDSEGGFEISRRDLAESLAAAVSGARIRWGDEIVRIRQDPAGVEATLASGDEIRSDIVVAADGLHSAVRGLVVAPEASLVSQLGLWIATLPYPAAAEHPTTVRVYNEPGRNAALHPAGGNPGVALMCRSVPAPDWDMRDGARQKAFIERAFAGSGWMVPSILEHLATADLLYFDQVSRVRVPRWSEGRVVLLGDAGSSVTIFGDGSSIAIAGAWELAQALGRHQDPIDAFAAYEHAQRARVEPRQRQVQVSSHFLVPASRPGLLARNALLRGMDRFQRKRAPA